ncbi:BQ5605_C031g10925 [Microbotryum silenes-dioicae]|uniref:BQ5605_C031g10925 protein n=1 Tax=Microbotryum silenes-dioicae TaxID=796604 RepID=A0A2X0MHR1_9BASI|nr:BQ5605_C031g10925 [Microbotryum silenes-dioicae]
MEYKNESLPPPAPPPKPKWMPQHGRTSSSSASASAFASTPASATASTSCYASTSSTTLQVYPSRAVATPTTVTRSPTVTRSIQPAGTAAHQRQAERANSSSTTPTRSPLNSIIRKRSTSNASATTLSSSVMEASRTMAGASVFCDVVVDQLRVDAGSGECVEPEFSSSFLNGLGSLLPFKQGDGPGLGTSTSSRPSSPRKPAKVDLEMVRRMLIELAHTEDNYYKKIKSLHEDFEKPLRKFAKVPTTAIIGERAVAGLFSNLQYLVPIAHMFNQDLQAMLGEMTRERRVLPTEFGPMIRHHIRGMRPFAEYLNDHRAADAIRRALDSKVSGFRTFIERQQVTSREKTQQTGGFKEILAEPFQRIARYQLMLEPILRHLPEDDPNVEPLQQALDTLIDICSMRIDTSKHHPAIQWALRTSIDSLPSSSRGGKYLASIDVDETYEAELGAKPTTLRCTLLLFENELVFAKRPSGNAKTGSQLLGLNDLEELLVQYKVQEAVMYSGNAGGIPSSPTKRSKGGLGSTTVMGYRGRVDILDSEPRNFSVDGQPGFAFVLDPPPMDQSERWNGRGIRRYTIASTYSSDAKKLSEKNEFLSRLAEAKARRWLGKGAQAVRRGGSGQNQVYWVLWGTKQWEDLAGQRRGKLALYVDDVGSGTSREILRGVDGHPIEMARATLLTENQCRFSVRSIRDNAFPRGEIIELGRIPAVISELGTSQSMLDVPVPRPTTPGGSARRTRSGLMDAALNVFGGGSGGGGGASSTTSSLFKGGNSTASRTSTGSMYATRVSSSSGLEGSFSPQSPKESSVASRDRPRSGLFGNKKRSEPDLPSRRRADSTSEQIYSLGKYDLETSSTPPVQSPASTTPNTSVVSRDSRPRHLRSSSLPPPLHARFDSTSSAMDVIVSSAEIEDEAAASFASRRRSLTEPSEQRLYSIPPIIPPTPVDSSRIRSEPWAPASSPMEYRPPSRRRMMGPRAPGSTPGGTPGSAGPPESRSQPDGSPSNTDTLMSSPTRSSETDRVVRAVSHTSTHSSVPVSSARDESPSPTQTLTPASASATMSNPNPRSPTPSAAAGSAVPPHIVAVTCPPSPLRHSISRRDSDAESMSAPTTKRPLARNDGSVPNSPARKRPSLGDASDTLSNTKVRGPRGPASGINRPRFGAQSGTSSSENSTDGRSASPPPRKVSASQIKIRSRRVTSGASIGSGSSTVRGCSPPLHRHATPPLPLSEADAQDVFVTREASPAPPELKRVAYNPDDSMDDDDTTLGKIGRIRKHVRLLRSRLSKETANASSYNKENDRNVPSPGGMTRSPHTRNVAIKANTPSSASFTSAFAGGRLAAGMIDIHYLTQWLEQLEDLVAKSEEVGKLGPNLTTPPKPVVSQSISPTEAEFAMLEAERELISAELDALKHELSMRVDDARSAAEAERLGRENTTLRTAYQDILSEIEALYEQFNTRLGEVVTAMQVDPTIGVSDDTYIILTSQLREAVLARSNAEHALMIAQHRLQRELDEKEEWRKILVTHGLLPVPI